MKKNLMPMILKELGVEPYEEFRILYNGGDLTRPAIYRFTETWLEFKMFEKGDWYAEREAYILFGLLNGYEFIKKIKE